MKTMRRNNLLRMLLAVFLFGISLSSIAQRKESFVLVDVSGTMTHHQTNQEAKQIIQDFLLGTFSYQTWNNKGWNIVDPEKSHFPTNKLVASGSKVILVPLGNMNGPRQWVKHEFSDNEGLKSFFEQHYPTQFRDQWTYLTLAKAWVGSIAISEKIKKAYVFIYTDGQPESTNQQLAEDDQKRVDDLGHAGHNSYTTIGILRKQAGNRRFQVEISEFLSYETIGVYPPDTTDTTDVIIVDKIKITSPKEGNRPDSPFSVNTKEEFNVNWTGHAVEVIVKLKQNGTYRKAPKESYHKEVVGNSAKIILYESGDYCVNVKNKDTQDTLYVSASSPFPFWIILCLIAAIVVVVVLRSVLDKGPQNPKRTDETGGTFGKKNNDDWE